MGIGPGSVVDCVMRLLPLVAFYRESVSSPIATASCTCTQNTILNSVPCYREAGRLPSKVATAANKAVAKHPTSMSNVT